ncbi:hypothetical protein H4R21_001088 [Coemansia helicoidea]|uniref:Uncharacterized protein n=1 Tax=Coemansia helicoidea TaxID=1286919 RepID=A0ACC1LDF6_9FUNG|nr:hypothetical protein H4R21_001088 [Coemansia helicoidea]
MEPTITAPADPAGHSTSADNTASADRLATAVEQRPTGKAQTTITIAVFAVWVLFAAALVGIILRKRRVARHRARSAASLEAAAPHHASTAKRTSKPTLTAPQLAQLPAMAFSDYAGTDASSEKAEAAIDTPTCAICLDDFQQACLVRALACSHVFHADCVDRWLLKRSCRCPLCNSDTRGILAQPKRPSSAKLAE